MKYFTMNILALLFAVTVGNSQTFQWAKSIGGPNFEWGHSVAIDKLGNVYTTGWFKGTIDFDPGPDTSYLSSIGGDASAYILKLNPNGDFLWARSVDATIYYEGLSIAVDIFGDVCIVGAYEGTVDFDPGIEVFNLASEGNEDVFIMKMDSEGTFLWAKSLGAADKDIGFSIVTDSFGNIYTSGYFAETVDFDPGQGIATLASNGEDDVFVLKLDSEGDFQWVKSLGGIGWAEGLSIDIDSYDNVYFTGRFYGTLSFDLGSGMVDLTSIGDWDIYISKLNSNGDFMWVKSIGGTNYEKSISITVDDYGNVYSTGFFKGTVDFNPGVGINNLTSFGSRDIFIFKLSSEGDFLWANNMGGLYDDNGSSIAVDEFGYVYVTGSFLGNLGFGSQAEIINLESAGSTDIVLTKMNSEGQILWAKNIGGESYEESYSIAVDSYSNLYLTGRFTDTSDFDPGVGIANLLSEGSTDAFILKLDGTNVGKSENSFDFISRIYPNPTKGEININLGVTYDIINVIVRNQIGQVVLNQSFKGLSVLQLDIPGLAGMYFIEVRSQNKNEILKVVKE